MSGSPVSVIVETLEASGVRFRLDGEKIKARLPEPSPPEVLEALETLRVRRSELIALLRERHKQTLAPCGAGAELPPLGSRNERGELVLTVADLPELERRLRLSGWNVTPRGNELICTSPRKVRIQ